MIVGLDIGGANIKAVHVGGAVRMKPFPLWKQPQDLGRVLRGILSELPAFDTVALTMTGELCDCFANKREGVLAILAAVEEAAGPQPHLGVWTTAGGFTSPAAVRENPLPAAAANWLALAHFAGRYAALGPALLVDVGSTTSDLVLLHDGRPAPRGHTDTERLRTSELVYTGMRRTPLCALLGPGHAAEVFATTLDAYLVLNLLPEEATNTDTADGKPATRAWAHVRLARMLCGDGESLDQATTAAIARKAAARQRQMLRAAAVQVLGEASSARATLILSGSGEFLARRALEALPWRGILSLSETLGHATADAACAHAVAMLWQERP